MVYKIPTAILIFPPIIFSVPLQKELKTRNNILSSLAEKIEKKNPIPQISWKQKSLISFISHPSHFDRCPPLAESKIPKHIPKPSTMNQRLPCAVACMSFVRLPSLSLCLSLSLCMLLCCPLCVPWVKCNYPLFLAFSLFTGLGDECLRRFHHMEKM